MILCGFWMWWSQAPEWENEPWRIRGKIHGENQRQSIKYFTDLIFKRVGWSYRIKVGKKRQTQQSKNLFKTYANLKRERVSKNKFLFTQKDKVKTLYTKLLEPEKMPMHVWCIYIHILKTEREKKSDSKELRWEKPCSDQVIDREKH